AAALAQLFQDIALDEAAVEENHGQAVELAARDRLAACEPVAGCDAQHHFLPADLDLAPLGAHSPRFEHGEVDAPRVQHAADRVGASLDDRQRNPGVSRVELG